jgi:soluble epoxide hydrolase/lipid-phosphate phosphatase
MDQLERRSLTTKRALHYTYYTSTAPTPNESALLFCHGFPDNSFLWNDILMHLHNTHNITRKIIIPDMLGYSDTSKPLNPTLYNYSSMSADLIDILDAEHVQTVTIIGHDWGSIMAQRFYPFHSSRVDKLILLNVAYHPPSKPGDPKFDLQTANEMLTASFGAPLWTYWDFFTSPDGPDLMRANLQKVYEAQHGDVENWSFQIFCVPGAWRSYLTGSESVPLKPYAQNPRYIHSFLQQFQRDSFEAPIQWYKATILNVQYDIEITIPLEKHMINVPVLFMGCTGDANNRVEFIEVAKGKGLLPDLRVEIVEAGHWSPLERPEEVAGLIAGFI